jgi:hypothetical protein
MVRIETTASSPVLVRCGAERCGHGRRPKTRRRLSGWLSNIRIRRIFLVGTSGDGIGVISLMTKIFFVRPRRILARERRLTFRRGSASILTNGIGKFVCRSSNRSRFMAHATARVRCVASARKWDFTVLRRRRSRPPLSGEHPLSVVDGLELARRSKPPSMLR